MTKLDEMWAALAKYQRKANDDCHGVTWAKMCKLKTAEAAYIAAYDAAWCAPKHCLIAAADTVDAADADDYVAADSLAQEAIDCINKATGETE